DQLRPPQAIRAGSQDILRKSTQEGKPPMIQWNGPSSFYCAAGGVGAAEASATVIVDSLSTLPWGSRTCSFQSPASERVLRDQVRQGDPLTWSITASPISSFPCS